MHFMLLVSSYSISAFFVVVYFLLEGQEDSKHMQGVYTVR
jgi:hypothetical protein